MSGDTANRDARFRLAARAAGLGIWEYRPDTGEFDCDEGALALLGLEPGGQCATFEGFLARVHRDDREGVRRRFQLALDPADRQPCAAEFRCGSPGEAARWLAAHGGVYPDESTGTRRLIGTLDDITARKQAEEDRERMVGELSRVVQSSELLMGILGHDLRNPLSAILTASELLLRSNGEEANDRRKKQLERISSSARRMTRMIEQLLDFTRIRFGGGIPLSASEVDLVAVGSQVIDELSQSHPGTSVRLQHQGDARGLWDADRLAQMLSNLVGNAIEHGTPGREVTLRIDGFDPGQVEIAVHNHGSIGEEMRARIFDPFQMGRDRPRTPGLGLGLYVVRQIVLAHGGAIDMHSGSDDTTTFSVRVPRRLSLLTEAAKPEMEREEREMVALEQFAARAPATTVTAQLFGAAALPDRAPRDYWSLLDRYSALLDLALERQTYRGGGEKISDEVRAIAERLGALGASAREVAELHARAIRKRTRSARSGRVQAVIAEGRMLAFELMGNVLSYYRRRAVGGPAHEPSPISPEDGT